MTQNAGSIISHNKRITNKRRGVVITPKFNLVYLGVSKALFAVVIHSHSDRESGSFTCSR